MKKVFLVSLFLLLLASEALPQEQEFIVTLDEQTRNRVDKHQALINHVLPPIFAAPGDDGLGDELTKRCIEPAKPGGLEFSLLEAGNLMARLTPEQAQTCASAAGVKSVVPNESAVPHLDTSVKVMSAPSAWSQGAEGSGSVVVVLDTGVDAEHPFLKGRVIHEACFSASNPAKHKRSACPNGANFQVAQGAALPPKKNISSKYHGTHIAGIIAGSRVTEEFIDLEGAKRTVTFSGVAPEAKIIAIQVFHVVSDPANLLACFPQVSPCMRSDILDQLKALDYVESIAKDYNIVAVNMSLGAAARDACDDHPFKMRVDRLKALGIDVVASSGNEGTDGKVSLPACVSSITSVGSISDDGNVAKSSNFSAALIDLLAPGVSIRSATPGGAYFFSSGTSQAAGHVSGALAVLRSRDRKLSVADVSNKFPQVTRDYALELKTTGTKSGRLINGRKEEASIADLKNVLEEGMDSR